jgi:hypothetical protein
MTRYVSNILLWKNMMALSYALGTKYKLPWQKNFDYMSTVIVLLNVYFCNVWDFAVATFLSLLILFWCRKEFAAMDKSKVKVND